MIQFDQYFSEIGWFNHQPDGCFQKYGLPQNLDGENSNSSKPYGWIRMKFGGEIMVRMVKTTNYLYHLESSRWLATPMSRFIIYPLANRHLLGVASHLLFRYQKVKIM